MDQRQKIQSAKEDLERQLKRSRDLEKEWSERSDSELSAYDQHPADSATDLFERERNLGITAALRHQIEMIDEALNRIDTGVYGICVECGEAIEMSRLQVLPYATRCIRCAQRLEVDAGIPSEEKVVNIGQINEKGQGFTVAGEPMFDALPTPRPTNDYS